MIDAFKIRVVRDSGAPAEVITMHGWSIICSDYTKDVNLGFKQSDDGDMICALVDCRENEQFYWIIPAENVNCIDYQMEVDYATAIYKCMPAFNEAKRQHNEEKHHEAKNHEEKHHEAKHDDKNEGCKLCTCTAYIDTGEEYCYECDHPFDDHL